MVPYAGMVHPGLAPITSYGYFPSISAAWRLIDEPFIGLKTRSVISDAKIRIGYGVVGNQEIPIAAIYTQNAARCLSL